MLSNMLLITVICAELTTLAYVLDKLTELWGWKVSVVGVELMRPHGQPVVLPADGLTLTIGLDGWVFSIRVGRVAVCTQTVREGIR